MRTKDGDGFVGPEKFDYFRTVDTNWRLVEQFVAERRRLVLGLHTGEVAEAVRYLRALGRCDDETGREAVQRRWLDLTEAHTLAGVDGPRRWEVEARILAGQIDDEIAKSCNVSAAAVGRFESLFFHVRPFLGASDWISLRAIRPGTPPNLGFAWKHIGYRYGPKVLDVVIAVSLDEPLPGWVRDLPGTDENGFEERLRLRYRLMIEWLHLPPDVDLLLPFRIEGVDGWFRSDRPQGRPGSSPADWVDDRLAKVRVERPSWKRPEEVAAGV